MQEQIKNVFHRKVEQKLVFCEIKKIFASTTMFIERLLGSTQRRSILRFLHQQVGGNKKFNQSLTQSIVQDETTWEYTKAFNPSPLISTIECLKNKLLQERIKISLLVHIYIHIRSLGSTQRRSIPCHLISIYMYNNRNVECINILK